MMFLPATSCGRTTWSMATFVAAMTATTLFATEAKNNKSIRTAMTNKVAVAVDYKGQRELLLGAGTLLSRTAFKECLVENLTPEECKTFIEQTIMDAGGHEVGDVAVKVKTPRTEEVLATTYWMVEVPVNIQGQFTCDRNEGSTFYPFDWTTPGSGDVTVPDVDCQGLTGGECCLKLRQLGQSVGMDVNGYCLGCFVHQDTLIPIVGGSGFTEYQDYVYDTATGNCDMEQYTDTEIRAFDSITQSKVDAASTALGVDFLANPTCATFETLLTTLYDAAATLHPLSEKIGQLACKYCYDSTSEDIATIGSDPLVGTILQLLLKPIPSSIENCVIIYTNKDGDIVNIPKLGGKRAEDPYYDDDGGNSGPPPVECIPEATPQEDGTCLCNAGFYDDGLGGCPPCDPRTISAPGDTVCTPCLEGYLEVNNTACEPCPPGTCQSGDLNECVPCLAGLFQPQAGQNFCLECPRGSVQPLEGQIQCDQCPDNWVQPKRGQTECNECPAGTMEGPRERCIPEETKMCAPGCDETCGATDACARNFCDVNNDCQCTTTILQTCAEGEACDPATGQCQALQTVVPCVAVIDEWNNNDYSTTWANFRSQYPFRQFCLLRVEGSGVASPLPAGFDEDSVNNLDGVDRTTNTIVNRDRGDTANISDWFTICGLDKISSTSIDFVGLFVDDSGSMRVGHVQASLDKFRQDLANNGFDVAEVFNGSEQWIDPFLTTLVPSDE